MAKAESKPPAAPDEEPQEDAIKETFESIVIAFILAFVFRAYVVEAFVIPTGSMAPTLFGQHLRVTCDQCGYHYKVDNPFGQGGPSRSNERFLHCPMCQAENKVANGTYISSGDRILVHKYLYSIEEPQRFDVVVFKAPEHPHTNYIKRLIGLPGQELLILEGNCYYNPTPGNEAGWRIARKTDPEQNRHAMKIQDTVWQPVYNSHYVPLDFGSERDATRMPNGHAIPAYTWRVPWRIWPEGDSNGWRTAASSDELDPRGGYIYEGTGRGVIRFDFRRLWVPPGPGAFVYSQEDGAVSDLATEDIRLAADIEPKQDGLSLTLATTARMDDPQGRMHRLALTIDPQGKVTLMRGDEAEPLGTATVSPLRGGASRHVELWYVDQEASVWIDGDRVLVKPFELPKDVLINRSLPGYSWGVDAGQPLPEHDAGGVMIGELPVPRISIEVSGSPVRLHRVVVDRDLYWTYQTSTKGTMEPSMKDFRGTIRKEPNRPIKGGPITLDADQFFCMGDNSPKSYDSRAWETVDEWVHARAFTQEIARRDALGIVPRRMMMGRAFFVYFPTMLGISPDRYPMFPNFGEMRFIH